MYVQTIKGHISNGDNMNFDNFLPVLYRSLISLFTLFIICKIIGKKQISELSIFDYVIGISIGNFAAEMTINLESPEFDGILAVIIFGLVAYLVSYLSLKSIWLRKFVMGKPTIIIQEGKFIRKNMSKVRLDMNDLLEEARIKGYFDLSEIQYGIMEANGEMSFLPYAKYQPITREDMNKNIKSNSLNTSVIIDGKILKDNLKKFNKTEDWLYKEIKKGKYELKDIMLCTIDSNQKLTYYLNGDNLETSNVLE